MGLGPGVRPRIRPRVRDSGLGSVWRARAGVLCMRSVRGWAGLQRVGENATSLMKSSIVVDPRQARMRMGACQRQVTYVGSMLGDETGWRGRFG